MSAKYTASNAVKVTQVHDNTDQEVIRITEDRVRLILFQNQSSFEDSKGWQTPLCLVLSLATIFTTTTVQSAIGLSADTWRAIFVIATFLSIIWLLRALWTWYFSASIDDVVDKMKSASQDIG